MIRIMKSCLEEYKECDVNDIAEKYIEGQPQVSAVPVLPDEGGTVISGRVIVFSRYCGGFIQIQME